MKKAIYPGSFDPVTNGHVDIALRATNLFDEVIVAVSRNPDKNYLFDQDERFEMTSAAFADYERIRVIRFDGLIAGLADREGVAAIVRGLRAVSDFEHEFQMALMNRKMSRDVETVFLMTSFRYVYLSSSIIKDTAHHGGIFEDLVPKIVEEKLKEKFPQKD